MVWTVRVTSSTALDNSPGFPIKHGANETPGASVSTSTVANEMAIR